MRVRPGLVSREETLCEPPWLPWGDNTPVIPAPRGRYVHTSQQVYVRMYPCRMYVSGPAAERLRGGRARPWDPR